MDWVARRGDCSVGPLRLSRSLRVSLLRPAAVVACGFAFAVLSPSAVASAPQSLSYTGGSVLHSSAPYLVFWTPPGESVPASSRALLRRYLSDTAADSGKSTNVFGVLRQYYDRRGFVDYQQRFNAKRQVIVDRQPYPAADPVACPDVSSAYRTCLSWTQLESELQRLVAVDGLPTAGSTATFAASGFAAHAATYLFVLPANVSSCTPLAGGGAAVSCTGSGLCAYHNWGLDSTNRHILVYAVIPMRAFGDGAAFPDPKGNCQIDGTNVTQEPNGNAADVVLTEVSHELSEMLTDPVPVGSWKSSFGTEVADNCNATGPFDPAAPIGRYQNPNAFLPILGGSRKAGTVFDQLINGHGYYTQSDWSNGSNGCEMRPTDGRIVPRFVVRPKRLKAGATLRFNPSGSASKHGYSSATWTFGDGSPTAFYSGSAALTTATHAYRKAGRYTVTLTLVDTRGNLESTTRHVIVRPR